MDIFKEIVEHYLFASLKRFKKNVFSMRSHKRIVLESGKKNRVIFVPNKYVKCAQYYVLENYLELLKYSDSCFAYTKGKSIVDMAGHHLGNQFFLHLDIKHFFDNMDYKIFQRIILENYSNSKIARAFEDTNENKNLRAILTYRGKFRQGSVTAPYISNLYLFEFDNYIKEYVVKNIPDGRYSRYSDDIIISSTKRINKDIIDVVRDKLKQLKLRINYKKIKFSNIYSSVRVTGLSITKDNRSTINTKTKKKIKTMIYNLLEKNAKINLNVLFGYIYFLIMCDPDYFNKLQNKYQKDNILMMDRIKMQKPAD